MLKINIFLDYRSIFFIDVANKVNRKWFTIICSPLIYKLITFWLSAARQSLYQSAISNSDKDTLYLKSTPKSWPFLLLNDLCAELNDYLYHTMHVIVIFQLAGFSHFTFSETNCNNYKFQIVSQHFGSNTLFEMLKNKPHLLPWLSSDTDDLSFEGAFCTSWKFHA